MHGALGLIQGDVDVGLLKQLSDELLRGHLDYAVKKGMIIVATVDDVLYFSAAK